MVAPFDPELWQQCLYRVAADQPAQRTTIVAGPDGLPRQIVADTVDPAMCPIIDARGLSQAELDVRLREEADRPFDLAVGPLYRMVVFVLDDDRHVIVAQSHHTVSDMWSLGLWLDSIARFYAIESSREARAPRPPRSTPIELAEAEAAWLETDEAEADLDYWLEKWGDVEPSSLTLPGGDPLAGEAVYTQCGRTLDAHTTARVVELAESQGRTASDALLAAVGVVMGRYSSADTVAVGAFRARRSLSNARTMTMLVNEIPLRIDVDAKGRFIDLIDLAGAEMQVGGEHDRVPVSEVIAALRSKRSSSSGSDPLFDVTYGWQAAGGGADGSLISALSIGGPSHEADLYGLGIRPWPLPEEGIGHGLARGSEAGEPVAPAATRSAVPMVSPISVVGALVGDRLHLAVRYQRHAVGSWFAERMVGHLAAVLEQAAEQPERLLSTVHIPDAPERAELARLGRGPERATPAATVVQGLLDRIADHPERDAVLDADQTYSYAELGRRIDRLAARLTEAGVGPNDTVGLHLGRTADLPVAILAVLRCGAAYVPVDTRYPADRIGRILDDAGVAAVVVDQAGLAAVDGPTEIVIGREAPASDAPAEGPDPDRSFQVAGPDGCGYIMYTSGSTGQPKGVRLTNATLVNLLTSLAARPGLGPDDRMLAIATLAFDISFVELILPLWVGGSVVVADADIVVDGEALGRLIDESEATVVQATPTTWQLLQSSGWSGGGLALWSTGEALSRPMADWLLANGKSLWNLFGPTETHVCTVEEVGAGAGPVRIGRPVDNTIVEVVGPDLRPVPLGLRGELLVGGAAVADGYHGRRDLTDARFSERGGDRWYRTGDQVSFGPDGRLEYHGRLDDQVKIRGHRVELGEIEGVAAEHPSVAAAAVALHTVGPGDQRLALYLVARSEAEIEPEEIHRFLSGRLPFYMLPSAVIPLDALPQLTSRKLDRRSLPAPKRWLGSSGGTAPRTATERMLARIWCDVLGLVDIGINDSFFDLGGHSLLATQIASRVRQLLGVELELALLYQFPTVADLAPIIDASERLPAHVVERVDRSQPQPLTYSQERIWFLQQFNPLGAAYNMPGAVRIKGHFDALAMEAALGEVVERQEIFRTRFVPIDGRPRQVIETDVHPRIEIVDHAGEAEGDRAEIEQRVLTTLAAEAARPFRLDQATLLRVAVHQLAEDDQVLFVNMHHILGDEWSFGVLFRELISRYLARRREAEGLDPDPMLELVEPSIQCVDYAVWQRNRLDSGELDDQIAYWIDQLADLPHLELPTDRARPPMQSGNGGAVELELPTPLVDGVADLARRMMTSPFVVMLSAFEALLHRYTGSEDVVVGCPVANRNTVDSEMLITSLVNSLTLRVGVASEQTFSELVDGVHQTAMAAFANQDVPFEKLVADLRPARDPSRSPLFQVFFNMLNAPYELPELPGLEMSFQQVDRGASQFDLTMTVHPRLGLLRIEYSTDLFDHDRIERMADHYLRLLASAIEDPEQAVGHLELVGEAERADLAETWGHLDVEPFDDESVLCELVRARAESDPDSRAVSSGDHTITYRELDRLVDGLAGRLAAGGVRPGDAVGILAERSLWSAVAMVGINRAGAAFVPLDPQMPVGRLRFMIGDSGATGLVTAGGLDDLVDRCRLTDAGHSLPLFRLGGTEADDDVEPPASDEAAVEARATDLAWIIYTSGSTGQPKGCEIEHRAAVNLFRSWAREPGIGVDDVVLSVTPASFDPSIQDIYLALINGAEVHIAPFEATIDAGRLAELIERSGATQMFSTPTTWRMLLDAGWAGRQGFMVQSGGEPLPRAMADALLERVDSVWNLYGLTETTIWSSAAKVEPGDGPVLVGPPVANTSFLVLGPGGEPVGTGIPGELCIGGAGLARGFRNRPELEAERFTANPITGAPHERLYRTGDVAAYEASGRLRILGRADGQVKLRGRRVDLSEIEAAVRSHPDIADAAVVVSDQAGEKQVVAFTVPTDAGPQPGTGAQPDDEALLDHLRRLIPAYMLPIGFVGLDALPLNPNGKVDRAALVVPDRSTWRNRAPEEPLNELERSLAALWEQHLGVAVGRRDDFFELGGNSLQAAALFTDITELTGREYPVSALFRGPTIAELAKVVGEDWRPAFTSLVPVDPRGSRRPFFSVSPFLISSLSFRLLSDSLDPEQPLYAFQPQGMDADDPVHDRVEEMAAHYLSELKAVQPTGPYRIGGHCAGNWVAFEMALQLQREGEEVEQLILVDWGPPGFEAERPRGLRPALSSLRHYWREGRIGPALAWQFGLVWQRVRARFSGAAVDRRIAAVRAAHDDAYGAYRPNGSFVGDALLIRSKESAERPDCDWHLLWRDLVDGSFEVGEVPGTHATLMLEPENTRVLAEHLSARFRS